MRNTTISCPAASRRGEKTRQARPRIHDPIYNSGRARRIRSLGTINIVERGSSASILDCLTPRNLFARPLRLPVTAEDATTTPRARCQLTSSSVSSWPGCTLEDWLKWLAGEATAYWRVHVRYYWTCWICGTDPRKIVSLKKRGSLKRAGASQQTLEQRSSLLNWPRAKQEINRLGLVQSFHCWTHFHLFHDSFASIIPQLNSIWSRPYICPYNIKADIPKPTTAMLQSSGV